MLETIHKPLVPLLSSKNLKDLSIRVQHFCLQITRFNYTIVQIPGNSLCTADALYQSPTEMTSCSDSNFQQEVDAYVILIINNLPVTDAHLKEIYSQQNEDPVCQKLKTCCLERCPDKSTLKGHIYSRSKWVMLLLRGSQFVIPPILKTDILNKTHIGHQGITKRQWRISQSAW